MDREYEEAAKRIHEAYLQCKETFAPSKMRLNDEVEFKDDEEELFYVLVSGFFLQRKQQEIINR